MKLVHVLNANIIVVVTILKNVRFKVDPLSHTHFVNGLNLLLHKRKEKKKHIHHGVGNKVNT